MASISRSRSFSLCRFFTTLSPNFNPTLTDKQKSRATLARLKSESDPTRILSICSTLSPNSHLDRVALSVAISKVSNSRSFDAIRSFLDSLISRPGLCSERTLSFAIVLYGQAAMLDDSLRIFRQFDDLAVPRSLYSLNSLIHACILAKSHHQVLPIFREFPKIYGITPDASTYNLIIKSLCESGQSSMVYPILQEMERCGCKPDTTSFDTLIAGLYKEERYDDAGKVLELMRKNGYRPGVSTYNMRIQSLCKLKKSDEAKALIDGMRSRGMKPNVVTYYHLIYGFCKEGNLEQAKRIFNEMGRKGCDPDSACYFTLAYYLCLGGDFDTALSVCKESIAKNWVPNVSTMKMLVNGLVSKSKVEEAREILGLINNRFSNNSEMWKEVEESFPQ